MGGSFRGRRAYVFKTMNPSLSTRIDPKEPVAEIKNSNVTLICEQRNGKASSEVSSRRKVKYTLSTQLAVCTIAHRVFAINVSGFFFNKIAKTQ